MMPCNPLTHAVATTGSPRLHRRPAVVSPERTPAADPIMLGFARILQRGMRGLKTGATVKNRSI